MLAMKGRWMMKKELILLIISCAFIIISCSDSSVDKSGSLDINIGLIGYYPFNGNAYDESGNGINAIVYGAELDSDRFGRAANAYYFDGIDDYIVIPDSQALDLDAYYNNYSISVWVKSDNPQYGARILSKWNENISTPYPFSIQASPEKCNAAIFDTQGAVSIKYGVIWDNEWHHIVMVVNNNENKIYGYLNSAFVDSSDFSNLISSANTSDIYIGIRPIHLNYYKGSIDDIRIYNRILNRTEIELLYEYVE